MQSIAILYLSVGSGHQVAAKAISQGFTHFRPDLSIMVEDPFKDALNLMPSMLNSLQTLSTVVFPEIYDMAWRNRPLDSNEKGAVIKILKTRLREKLIARGTNVVIATHVLPCIIATKLKEEIPTLKVFGVVTDFGLHLSWPTENMDGYFVADEELKQTLIYRKVNPDIIHVTGIPIDPKFSQPAEEKTKPGAVPHILLIAGSVRSSAYAGLRQYYFDLIESLNEINSKFQVTVVCGNQNKLRKDLTSKFEGKVKYTLRVRGFVNNIHRLMVTHDIIITKPGGLTIAEALASGMCIIIYRPGPGQETANADFLARNGLAFRGETPYETRLVVNNCLENRALIDSMKIKTRANGHPLSSHQIAETILAMQEN
jgi:processive 1,2-diacylglycerol beta-glucosyltransferase